MGDGFMLMEEVSSSTLSASSSEGNHLEPSQATEQSQDQDAHNATKGDGVNTCRIRRVAVCTCNAVTTQHSPQIQAF